MKIKLIWYNFIINILVKTIMRESLSDLKLYNNKEIKVDTLVKRLKINHKKRKSNVKII